MKQEKTQPAQDRDVGILMDYMSGYARELFVSNILSYMVDHHPKALKEAFKELGLPHDWDEAQREFKHTDLTFKKGGKAVLVIENKTESSANDDQLRKYKINFKKENGGDIDHTIFLLISPNDNDRFVAECNSWQYVGYAALAVALKKAMEKEVGDSEALQHLILKEVLKYMESLDRYNNSALDAVTPATKIADLEKVTGQGKIFEGRANKKKGRDRLLAYQGVCKRLNEALKQAGQQPMARFSKGTAGKPVISLEVPIVKESRNDKYEIEVDPDKGHLYFAVQFMDEHLSMGFLSRCDLENHTDKKSEKIERLSGFWKKIGGKKMMEVILGDLDRDALHIGSGPFEVLEKGYLSKIYTMPMIHAEQKGKNKPETKAKIAEFQAKTSIQDIIDQMIALHINAKKHVDELKQIYIESRTKTNNN